MCGLSPGDRTGTRSSHTEKEITIRRKLQTEEKDGPQRLYMRLNFIDFLFMGRTGRKKMISISNVCGAVKCDTGSKSVISYRNSLLRRDEKSQYVIGFII